MCTDTHIHTHVYICRRICSVRASRLRIYTHIMRLCQPAGNCTSARKSEAQRKGELRAATRIKKGREKCLCESLLQRQESFRALLLPRPLRPPPRRLCKGRRLEGVPSRACVCEGARERDLEPASYLSVVHGRARRSNIDRGQDDEACASRSLAYSARALAVRIHCYIYIYIYLYSEKEGHGRVRKGFARSLYGAGGPAVCVCLLAYRLPRTHGHHFSLSLSLSLSLPESSFSPSASIPCLFSFFRAGIALIFRWGRRKRPNCFIGRLVHSV